MEEVEGEEQVEKEEEGDMEEVEGEEQVVEEEEEEDEAEDGVERGKRRCRDLLLWLAMAVTRFKKTFIYRIKLYRNVPVFF